MKIRPLGNSITGLNSYGASAQTTQQQEATATQQSRLQTANDDAASISVKKVSAESTDRADLIKKLKEQVDSGTYAPKSEDVATSIARDLL